LVVSVAELRDLLDRALAAGVDPCTAVVVDLDNLPGAEYGEVVDVWSPAETEGVIWFTLFVGAAAAEGVTVGDYRRMVEWS
jgi:hypothetical protein